MLCSQMARKYELGQRAERMAETRRRIVEAAVDLHTTVGPARTSLAAVAEHAGVQRHTLYAHFPSRRELFAACSAHWEARHPFPDTSGWTTLEDALPALYGWYERVEDDLALFRGDMAVDDDVRELQARDEAELARVRDRLAGRGGKLRRAVIGHALEFETWRSLRRRQGLSRRAAVQAMLALVASV